MTEDTGSHPTATASLVGDACLFSAASVFGLPLSIVLGPALAWWLHGRTFDAGAVLGWLAGLLVAVAVVGGFLVGLPLALQAAAPSGPEDFTVPIILLSIAGAALFAVAAALAVVAIRDLMPGRRARVRVDIVRLAAVAVLVVGAVAIFMIQRAYPASEVGSAAVFALATGAIGAITTWVACAVQRAWLRRGARTDTPAAA